MTSFKRFVAFSLLLCMLFTMLPPTQLAEAAESAAGYRYELDTDGIDVGAQYLIVSGTGASESALRMDPSTIWQTSQSTVTVVDGTTIEAFTNDSACLWTFSSTANGTVSSNGYYLNIEQYARYQSAAATVQFAHLGGGTYGIYLHGGSNTNLQYLGCTFQDGTASWSTKYNYGKVGTDPTAYESYIYLYKRVEAPTGVNVLYHSNGSTAGELPDDALGLEPGTQYTLLAPKSELRKDVGNDTFLFRGWNTAADGSGTEYQVGDTITVTENITLYAEWYLQSKYAVTVITYLDDVPTDAATIMGTPITIYVRSEAENSALLELTRVSDGTYVVYVTENGTYNVYVQPEGGVLDEAHGHKVVIYNQDGNTELLNYSIRYDANGGTWAEGEAPAVTSQHAKTAVTATDKVPTREGHIFRGWMDQNGNLIAPGGTVTESLTEATTLTAQWDDLIDVTVKVTVDHTYSGGFDTSSDKCDVLFQLLQEQNGVNLPYLEPVLLSKAQAASASNNTTTYTYTFTDLPQGLYNATSTKSHYDVSVTRTGESTQDQVIELTLAYAPDSFDLHFNVTASGATLLPSAVNVKILCWGNNAEGELGWTTITQQAGDNVPITVLLDENGNGSGFFPVWRADDDTPYVYRVEISSFIMPDGSILPAKTNDFVTYSPNGSDLYTAQVTVEGGQIPAASGEIRTDLSGAYYDAGQQNGTINIQLQVSPYTVIFDAGEGTLNGQQTLFLENQYAYPDLSQYIPVGNDEHHRFSGWYLSDQPAENLGGTYLTGDNKTITYVAKYSPHVALTGTVTAQATYEQNGQTVTINPIDRIREVLVVVQKNINGVYNDVDSQLVDITYDGTEGTGTYAFEHLPNDGTGYRVLVLTHNYHSLYDNNGDDTFAETEYEAIVGEDNAAKVDIALALHPDCYNQWLSVDSSQIESTFRPDSALVQVLYRDLGDIHPYAVIAQHTSGDVEGVQIPLDDAGTGYGFESLWKWHNDGTLYEYQLLLHKLYGTVEGAYTAEGTVFNENSPFTVEYGHPNYYTPEEDSTLTYALQATLIPKQYEIVFDLNLDDPNAVILGMDAFHMDANTASDYYAYLHTWSFADNFSAFPYREGYVFDGWTSSDETSVVVTDHGNIRVGAAVSETITLTANWIRLTDTDYTVRYLELNTDKVLHGATAVTGSKLGTSVKAADAALAIDGYTYAGAMIGGTYYDKTENPALTVSNDPLNNLLVVYYLPDGSDGYTEQVESNLNLNKTAVLENNGTYTINLETYTKDNPITTLVQQNTPLDIVLVLDQSGSIINSGYLDDLQAAVNNFIGLIAKHGRDNEVDHRIAMVGYAGDYDEPPTSTDTSAYPIAGGNTTNWVNTGVFDSNGDFHPYSVTGFNYTEFTGNPTADGTYYAYSEGEYLLLTHHDEYRHLITEEQARMAVLEGTQIYGYTGGQFVELTRNTSGLWLYGDKQLYSMQEFFTYHQDVWTHRKGLDYRQIHAYGTGDNYSCTDGHGALYQRKETTAADPQLSVYHDALVPVSVGAYGSGGVNPGLTESANSLGSNGGTYVQYGIEMANRVFAANPLDPSEGRIRIMVMFTDGLPGIGTFDATVANEAIAQAYIAKNTHNAYSYTIGLYPKQGMDGTNDEAVYMNAVSSNYPSAQTMADVLTTGNYTPATNGSKLNSGGPYYVQVNGNYYLLQYTGRWVSWFYRYGWSYTVNGTTTYISDSSAPTVTNGQVGGYNIYTKSEAEYKPTEHSGYYSTTESEEDLKDYFAHIMQEITTKITTEIILHEDTILRDIMGQGLVLTPGTVVTAYTQQGSYNSTTGGIDWKVDANGEPVLVEKASLRVGSGDTTVEGEDGVCIHIYNLEQENVTDPNAANYHPHAVDITGYDFADWYINSTHTTGYKMVVKITRVEARDDVQWGRSTSTNYYQSGLWLPADANGNRQLLLPFEQPTTIFVERAYVLDYGKEFTLSGWYFDDQDGKDASAIHVDCDIENGMNWFDENDPNTSNAIDGEYGNTSYGNVTIENGKVTYKPVTTNWDGMDQFYIFGNTWRKTVLAQDANENGNLWNKVTVIPANNVYYEDSFITTQDSTVNGIDGFTFTGAWETVTTENPGQNVENPEHQESAPYGNVHGWTDSLGDDKQYSDGSAHVTGQNGEMGASVEFTFTGTGIEVYTRTNSDSGIVVALLNELVTKEDGTVSQVFKKSIAVDNLAMSGDYYQIPTISFTGLTYGTYTLKLIATAANVPGSTTNEKRCSYYLDGIRVYNPMGSVLNHAEEALKDAYGKELNATFTDVREVLLDYGDFNTDMADTANLGAVFIDWIQEDQGTGSDEVGTAKPSYELGTFEAYGPKYEVYLSQGQAIVLKVDPKNTYYVGLKTLNTDSGNAAIANISGIDLAEPTQITVSHTTDMYYHVTPVDGYIVIQNGATDGSILSVTRLRTTNMYDATAGSGILPVSAQEAVEAANVFSRRLEQALNQPPVVPEEPETPDVPTIPQPSDPTDEETPSLLQQQTQMLKALAQELFLAVRTWLEN